MKTTRFLTTSLLLCTATSSCGLLSGCGGISNFERALTVNENANAANVANYAEYSRTVVARDSAVFAALGQNEAAAVAYACVQNQRDLAAAQTFAPKSVRMPATTGELVASTLPVVGSTLVTGVLGWKALDSLPALFENFGSDYDFNAGNDLNVSDVGNTFTGGDYSSLTKTFNFAPAAETALEVE